MVFILKQMFRLLRLENSYERSTSSIMFSGKERAFETNGSMKLQVHFNFIISFAGKMILRKEITSIDSLSTNPLSPNALTSVVPQMIVNRRLQLQCVIGLPRLCVPFLSLMLLKTGDMLIIWPLAKVKNFEGMSHTIH